MSLEPRPSDLDAIRARLAGLKRDADSEQRAEDFAGSLQRIRQTLGAIQDKATATNADLECVLEQLPRYSAVPPPADPPV